jgi:hypothetical protein
MWVRRRLLVPNAPGLCRQQHTLPEKSHLSPAIHLPFEHFQTIDLPLNGPGAPRQGDARFDGIIIRSQAIGQALERLKATGCSTLKPGFKLARLMLTHERGKILRQRDRLGDFTLGRLEPSELLLFA